MSSVWQKPTRNLAFKTLKNVSRGSAPSAPPLVVTLELSVRVDFLIRGRICLVVARTSHRAIITQPESKGAVRPDPSV